MQRIINRLPCYLNNGFGSYQLTFHWPSWLLLTMKSKFGLIKVTLCTHTHTHSLNFVFWFENCMRKFDDGVMSPYSQWEALRFMAKNKNHSSRSSVSPRTPLVLNSCLSIWSTSSPLGPTQSVVQYRQRTVCSRVKICFRVKIKKIRLTFQSNTR